jgi:hypothetical protein
MASEIRVNKIANRAGLSTVEYTDTGIIVSGIVTCTEISGLNALNIAGVSTFASPLDINGDIDVDGHTNLDNLSVAGVSTFSSNITLNGGLVASSSVTAGQILVGSGVTIESNQVATGQATFTGIVTASSFRGDGSQLTGIVAGLSTISGVVNVANDLDVDGHTNLDNVSIAGVTTHDANLKLNTNKRLQFGTSSNSYIYYESSGTTIFETTGGYYIHRYKVPGGGAENMIEARPNNSVLLFFNGSEKLKTTTKGIQVGTGVTIETNGQATYTGIVTATSFSGDGSSLSNLPAGAPVGGASTNTVFFENDKAVAVNYQVTSTKNAMSAGPIAINAGIAVTVPSGCSWTIV